MEIGSEVVAWFFARSWIVTLQVLWVFLVIAALTKFYYVSAKVIYFVYVVLLIRLCIPVHCTFITDRAAENIALPIVTKTVMITESNNATYENNQIETIQHQPWDFYMFVLLIWSLVVAIGIFVLLSKMLQELRLVDRYERIQRKDIEDLLKKLIAKMNIRSDVELAISERGPCVIGIRKITILLPEAVVCKWDTHEIEPILIHELSHIKRGDLWSNCIQNFVQVAYFFHPLVWILNRQIRKWRELACDESATKIVCKKHYCSIMLKVALDHLKSPSFLWATALLYNRTFLEERIKNMLQPKKFQLGKLLIVLVILLVSSTLLAQSQAMYKYRFNKEDFRKVVPGHSPMSIAEEQILKKVVIDIPGVETIKTYESHWEVLCTASSAVEIKRLFNESQARKSYTAEIMFIETSEEPQDRLSFRSFSGKVDKKNTKGKVISAPRIVNCYGHLGTISVFNEHSYIGKYKEEFAENSWVADPVVMNVNEGITIEILVVRSLTGKFYVTFKVRISKLQKLEEGRQQLSQGKYLTIQIPQITTWEHKEEVILSSLPSSIESTSIIFPNRIFEGKPVKIRLGFQESSFDLKDK